jgi:iron complex transport system substrate-binding protein
MMKKAIILFLVSILSIFAVACGANSSESTNAETTGEKITITHELGKTTVTKNPKNVIVFDFGSLETLEKLGVEITGLPKMNLPAHLSKYKDAKYGDMGSLVEPNLEKISQAKPDLIIISARQAELYKELEKIAPTIYMAVDTNNYMESFKNNVTKLAEIFDKKAEVTRELAKIDSAVDSLQKKVSANNKNALIVLVNEGKVSAYGPKSRFGLIHDVFGVPAVDPNIKVSTHGQSVTFEYIVEKNPDYLFVVDRSAVVGGKDSAKQTIENDLIKNTKAYQEGNIIYLDPNYWYLSGGGLTSVEKMVQEVSNGIK